MSKTSNTTTSPFLDLKDDYNRHLRSLRRKRRLAILAVILAAGILAAGFVTLVGIVATPFFSAPATLILIAGFWGAHYLLTRH